MTNEEKKKIGRPRKWEETEKFSFKGPLELKEKIEMKVRSLKARGYDASASKIQRLIIENNIDDVDRFFTKEVSNR